MLGNDSEASNIQKHGNGVGGGAHRPLVIGESLYSETYHHLSTHEHRGTDPDPVQPLYLSPFPFQSITFATLL